MQAIASAKAETYTRNTEPKSGRKLRPVPGAKIDLVFDNDHSEHVNHYSSTTLYSCALVCPLLSKTAYALSVTAFSIPFLDEINIFAPQSHAKVIEMAS